MEHEAQQPEDQPTLSQEPQPDLTVNDLSNIRQLIEAAVKRGAFAANELSGVGSVYDKLNNFLNAIASNKPKQ